MRPTILALPERFRPRADTLDMNLVLRTVLKPFLSSNATHVCDPASPTKKGTCPVCRLGDPYTLKEPRYAATKPRRPTRFNA